MRDACRGRGVREELDALVPSHYKPLGPPLPPISLTNDDDDAVWMIGGVESLEKGVVVEGRMEGL